MEDIIKLHDKKFRIMIPAAKIDEAVAASAPPSEVLGALRRTGLQSLPVVDGDRRVVGWVSERDLVIFNRCQDEHPLANFRRSVKVVNSRAEVVFENEEGEIDDIFQDEMPYDMNADIIDIEDIDYGIWYVDMMDNLDKYVDKTVRFKGQVLKSRELNAGFFVPGRMAMTCCADDTQFIGYICKNPAAKRLRIGSWVTVTAKVKDEFMEVYNGRGPVLYATEIEAAEKPEQELVYFG